MVSPERTDCAAATREAFVVFRRCVNKVLLSLVFLLWPAITLAALAGEPAAVLERQGALVVHFDENQNDLTAADKGRIRNLLKQYALGTASKIFVVGHADSTGGKAYNLKLSKRRAQNVRRVLLSTFGLEAQKVIALGKGAEDPVAANGSKAGRAQNRRVEIFLVNADKRRHQSRAPQPDPNRADIIDLVEKARILVKQQKLQPALARLQQARAIGGDRYSDWHAVFGIAGFYAGVPLEKVKTHLRNALRLDPQNFEARDFIARIEARERVARGDVTAAMGRSAADPIAVNAMVQQYEYLQLFGVEPQARHTLEDRPVDVWEGRDRQQRPVAYYFDHSQIYTWIFFGEDDLAPAKGVGAAVSPPPVSRIAPPERAESSRQPAKSGRSAAAADRAAYSPERAQAPRDIWQSSLFQ